MSETLLETAQNPNEAVTTTETAADPVTAAVVVETQQASSEPLAAADQAKEPPAAETPKVEGAPESYAFQAPEGQSYDPKVLTAFGEAARAANLTQDAAQKLIDSMAPALAARQAEGIAAIQKEWAEAVLADKELGGERGSAPFVQKMGVAKKFVAAFDSDGSFSKLLEDTGLGNHPSVLRVLYRAGKAISEDTFVGRGNREGGAVDMLSVLYPTTAQE